MPLKSLLNFTQIKNVLVLRAHKMSLVSVLECASTVKNLLLMTVRNQHAMMEQVAHGLISQATWTKFGSIRLV